MKYSSAADFRPIAPVVWELTLRGSARKPIRLLADDALIETIHDPPLLQQLRNVASLPGIVEAVWALPNVHASTAFPVGCVAASDPDAGGVVTPMAVGDDPFCGVRLMTIDLDRAGFESRLPELLNGLARTIPTGNRHGRRQSAISLHRALLEGAAWAVELGFGSADEIALIESLGSLVGADPDVISGHAKALGEEQLGSLGDGHHFIEFGYVDSILDEEVARTFGLTPGQPTVLVQAGSRGLGRQVLSEYQRIMSRAAARHLIHLPDRQLYCAPVHSHEGRDYLAAMASAANFAFANRQVLAHHIAHTIQTLFGTAGQRPAVQTVYEQCHNTISLEIHTVKGNRKRLCVHRRGASRIVSPGHGDLPLTYQAAGQPVILPGHYTTGSYICVSHDAMDGLALASVPAHTGAQAQRRSARDMLMMRKPEEPEHVLVHANRSMGERHLPGRDLETVTGIVEAGHLVRRVARIQPLAVFRA